MIGKKELLGRVINRSGLGPLLRRVRRNQLTVFCYHRIAAAPRMETPFDPGVYTMTAAEFEEQLSFFSGRHPVVSEADLLQHLEGKSPLPHGAVMLTFDDGYKDNYEIARPLLKKYGFPASFFIPTRIIDERELGWWDQIACIIGQSSRHVDKASAVQKALAEYSGLKSSVQREEFMTGLRQYREVDPPARSLQSGQLMTWDEIRNMIREG